jgi:transcriptional regulator with PAS, ATPase and Fis domain
VRRLGGKSEIAVDARVLAATNQSPQANLREDLYYRLNVFQIMLPPLRERTEDIPIIAEVMIQILNRKHGTRVTDLHSEVLDAFDNYDWPGNARELRNVIERATIIANVGTIRLSHLSAGFGAKWGAVAPAPLPEGSISPLQPGYPLSKAEEAYILLTLAHVNNNRKQAAEMLGISLRTLQYRLTTFRKEAKSATV